jgi:pantetheine-phosphate adenylyltransferase
MKKKLKSVAVGGTFDQFHKGHRAVLMKAFEVGNYVLIGLSSDNFVKKLRKPHKVAPYPERLKDLQSYLKQNGLLDRAEIIALQDTFGVTLSKSCLEAIVVSEETAAKAQEINKNRKALGLPPLAIFVVELVKSDNNLPISTSRIRKGKTDREGHVLKPHV